MNGRAVSPTGEALAVFPALNGVVQTERNCWQRSVQLTSPTKLHRRLACAAVGLCRLSPTVLGLSLGLHPKRPAPCVERESL